jgi:hypothetical protein
MAKDAALGNALQKGNRPLSSRPENSGAMINEAKWSGEATSRSKICMPSEFATKLTPLANSLVALGRYGAMVCAHPRSEFANSPRCRQGQDLPSPQLPKSAETFFLNFALATSYPVRVNSR